MTVVLVQGQEESGSRSTSKANRRVLGSSYWRLFSLIPKLLVQLRLNFPFRVLVSFSSSFQQILKCLLHCVWNELSRSSWRLNTIYMANTLTDNKYALALTATASTARWHAFSWPARSCDKNHATMHNSKRTSNSLDLGICPIHKIGRVRKWSAAILASSRKNWYARLMNSAWISNPYRFSAGAPSYTSEFAHILSKKQQPTSRKPFAVFDGPGEHEWHDLLRPSDRSRKRNCPTTHGIWKNVPNLVSLYVVSIVGIS